VTDNQSGEKTIRRNSGQFANERDVKTWAPLKRPEEADGFRIWKDGAPHKTVSIRSEGHSA